MMQKAFTNMNYKSILSSHKHNCLALKQKIDTVATQI